MIAIDVDHEISTTERRLGERVLEAGTARVMTISRVYDTGLEDLWEACTSPERIARWFLPVSGDLRPGGRYQIQGNASGTVERCDAPRSFTATWEMRGDVSWIEVRLEPEGDDRTRFVLEHVAHVADELWDQFGPGAVGVGWDLALMGLGLHLATGAANDPAEGEAWTGSPEGRAFVAAASRAWADASIAAGTPEEQARASEQATTSFYTPAG